MTKRKDPKDYVKTGRPTTYTLALATEICETISSSEKGLLTLVTENPHWPERALIFKWILRHPEFKHMYQKAKENQVEVSVEYTRELMDEPHKYIDSKTGEERIDVSLVKLKVDTMKWHAAKLKAKKYGDIKEQEVFDQSLDEDCKRRYSELNAG